jgi:acetyltransferase-like isoleucine patch superfamily enzyme
MLRIINLFFRVYNVIYISHLNFFYKNVNIKGHVLSEGFFKIDVSKSANLNILGTIVLRSNVLLAVRDNASLTIKDNCFFNRYTSIVCRENIKVGKNSIFGEGVKIYDNDHKIINGVVCRDKFSTKKIIIGDSCWIGNGVNILKGSIVKDKTIIGAMSLVKRELNKEGIYAGIPVRFLGYKKNKEYKIEPE